jgi:hypothetical protein
LDKRVRQNSLFPRFHVGDGDARGRRVQKATKLFLGKAELGSEGPNALTNIRVKKFNFRRHGDIYMRIGVRCKALLT